MRRADRVLWLVDQLHRVADEPHGYGAPWLIGWIMGCVKPDNGYADYEARQRVQEAGEAWTRFLDERLAAEMIDAAADAEVKYEREDPEASGDPLPSNVDGFSVGGRTCAG